MLARLLVWWISLLCATRDAFSEDKARRASGWSA